MQAGTYVKTVTASCSGAVDAFTSYVTQLFATHPSSGTTIAAGCAADAALGYQAQPATLPHAPADDRLSHEVHHFSRTGQLCMAR